LAIVRTDYHAANPLGGAPGTLVHGKAFPSERNRMRRNLPFGGSETGSKALAIAPADKPNIGTSATAAAGVERFIVGRHGAEQAPPNDPLMAVVVSALLLLFAGVCLLAVF
jgi:hypothetical protein